MSHGYGYRSEQRLRKENQDTHGVFEFDGFTLLVVCDGMGGHVGGAQASALAVRTMHDELSTSTAADLPGHLERAVEAANRAIYEEARRNYKLMGMGTTVVAAAVSGTKAWIAHVGDSRCYLVRGGEARSVTRDHTMVNLFVDAELLSPEDAATHPEAHVLSRSLGVERQVDVDVSTQPLQLRGDDRLLLCSDGVHGVVDDVALATFDWANPQRGSDIAMEAVSIAEGDDNATLVAFGTEIAGPTASPTTPPDPEAVAEAMRAASGNVEVQPVSAGPVLAGNVPYDDVAPIEEFDEIDVTQDRPSAPVPVRVDPVVEKRTSLVKMVAAMGSLAVIGLGAGTWFFSDAPPPRKPQVVLEAGDSPNEAQAAHATVAPKDGPTIADKPSDEQIADIPPEAARPAADPPDAADEPPDAASEPPDAVADQGANTAGVPATHDEPSSDGIAAVAAPADNLMREGPDTPTSAPVASEAAHAEMASHAEIAEGAEPEEGEEGLEGEDASPKLPPYRPGASTCLSCTMTYGIAPVEAYLPDATEDTMVVNLFAPDVPAPPKRQPHQASRFDRPAPRGPDQAAAVRAARDKDCRGTTDVVTAALTKSVDFASLYRTAWLCSNDVDQLPLRTARATDLQGFYELLPFFEGDWVPPENDDPALAMVQPKSMPYDEPASGGLEYRLALFEADTKQVGFQPVILDLLGAPLVADTLGTDLFMEATAAAALSRLDEPEQKAVEVWARRVYVTASTMNGPVGDLVRRHRPDLSTVIEALIFEASGGDEGVNALQSGVASTAVPQLVAEAYARALGRPAPSAAPKVQDDEGDEVASVTPRPRVSTRPRRPVNTTPRPAQPIPKRPAETMAAQDPQTDDIEDNMVIRVYKRRPEIAPRD